MKLLRDKFSSLEESDFRLSNDCDIEVAALSCTKIKRTRNKQV